MSGKIFYVMGKSASGKDTIYKRLRQSLPQMGTVVMYTTRPMRDGEENGREYHFTDREFLERVKKEEKSPVAAAISKPYKGIAGIKRSAAEARSLFHLASVSGASAFTASEEVEVSEGKPAGLYEDSENLIINALRKNSLKALKEAFVQFIYSLPDDEEQQCSDLHRLMVKTEFMLRDTYGLTDEIKEKFQNYYYHLQELNAARAVDVCYKILCSAAEAGRKRRSRMRPGILRSICLQRWRISMSIFRMRICPLYLWRHIFT